MWRFCNTNKKLKNKGFNVFAKQTVFVMHLLYLHISCITRNDIFKTTGVSEMVSDGNRLIILLLMHHYSQRYGQSNSLIICVSGSRK